VELAHIDPADVRRDVSLLSQNARLFHGTLRENLLLGASHATDEQILAALQAAGAWSYVRKLPLGLDHPVQEGGLGLSGGQRQGILLARTLLRAPRVLLLDEPTTALDDAAEREVLACLRLLPPERTLMIATHRTAVLEAVQRIIVVDGGTIVMDGPKDEVLARLRGNDAVQAQTLSDAAAPAGQSRVLVRRLMKSAVPRAPAASEGDPA